MSREIGEELDQFETEEFLKQRGLGVLALSKGAEAYSLPIAFAYDEAAEQVILRFVMAEDSMKRDFAEMTDVASLTVYEWADTDDWTSAVLRGPISPIPDEDLGQAAALFSDTGEESALEVFNHPITTYDTEWYAMDVEERTARGRFP